MATISHMIIKLACPAKKSSRGSRSCPFRPAQARIPLLSRTHKQNPAVSCSAKDQNNQNGSDSALNRRDVLMGIGGLYGAAVAVSGTNAAKAEPVETPELKKCGNAKLPPGAVPMSCCPPVSDKAPKIFTPPGLDTPLRVRPAAHLVDKEYIAKISEALKRMKALPADDPRSFKQQAMIHCAYCDGVYEHAGLPVSKELQVHNSWLFFPFHRCYLYFFERILGKLIDDPSFAMPFWNWDAAGGMRMPAIYTNPRSPLFDTFRNPDHMPPKMLDLDYGDEKAHNAGDENMSEAQLVEHNYNVMYKYMRTNSATPELFFGKAYKAGDDPEPGAGSIENVPHGTIHYWVGDPLQPNYEDMGSLYSAGRDPLFYAHHSNVDRMWNIWKTLGRRNIDICDPDWLNASFLLYDENAELVQITVADCLNSERQMRYKYQDVPIEWLEKKPTVSSTPKTRSLQPRPELKEAQFPLVLDTPVRVTLKRPKTNRSDVDKKSTEEVLKIDGIRLNRDLRAKFDVLVNANNHENIDSSGRELLGSFVNVPHKHKHSQMGMTIVTSIQFGLTEVIDDLGANADETISDAAPKQGEGQITITEMSIGLSS